MNLLTNQEMIEKARKEIDENRVEIETVRELTERLRCAEIKMKMIHDLYTSA